MCHFAPRPPRATSWKMDKRGHGVGRMRASALSTHGLGWCIISYHRTELKVALSPSEAFSTNQRKQPQVFRIDYIRKTRKHKPQHRSVPGLAYFMKNTSRANIYSEYEVNAFKLFSVFFLSPFRLFFLHLPNTCMIQSYDKVSHETTRIKVAFGVQQSSSVYPWLFHAKPIIVIKGFNVEQ